MEVDQQYNVDTVLPWYRHLEDPAPFRIQSKFKFDNPDSNFSCIQPFPWDNESREILWSGALKNAHYDQAWTDLIEEWGGAFVVYGNAQLLVMTRKGRAFTIQMLEDETVKDIPICCCAWAMSSKHPCEPYILFNEKSVLHVLSVRRRRVMSSLVGHGGLITSISVHPVHPELFCTTSRDFTARVYDLSLKPRQKPNNPTWPPATRPSRGGAPAGLHASEPEGDVNGMGRCIAILAGGRSGGHQAAVLNSAFHPFLPLIATCGVDRFVKIWKLIYDPDDDSLVREDKPLFSSSRIHQSRVLSVSWLSEDLLISHCANVHLRTLVDDQYRIDEYPGSLVLWRWLGLPRFFPPGAAEQPSTTFRGCASVRLLSTSFAHYLTPVTGLPRKWQVHSSVLADGVDAKTLKASFKFISAYLIPKHTQHLQIYNTPTRNHDPIALLSSRNQIQIVNITKFKPRPPPPFPHASLIQSEVSVQQPVGEAKRRRVSVQVADQENNLDSADYEQEQQQAKYEMREIGQVEGWTLSTESDDVIATGMGPGGRTILTIGRGQFKKASTVWKWRVKNPV